MKSFSRALIPWKTGKLVSWTGDRGDPESTPIELAAECFEFRVDLFVAYAIRSCFSVNDIGDIRQRGRFGVVGSHLLLATTGIGNTGFDGTQGGGQLITRGNGCHVLLRQSAQQIVQLAAADKCRAGFRLAVFREFVASAGGPNIHLGAMFGDFQPQLFLCRARSIDTAASAGQPLFHFGNDFPQPLCGIGRVS